MKLAELFQQDPDLWAKRRRGRWDCSICITIVVRLVSVHFALCTYLTRQQG